MKNNLLLFILLIGSINTFSQTEYEKGYFISNNGEQVEGLIKNKDWIRNPKEISFKYSENSETQTKTIDSLKEFQIYSKSKYQRVTVDMDKSSETLTYLDEDREPKFEKVQLFLKVLIEGKASLYYYEDRNFKKLFYKTDDSDIEQLVYKNYLKSATEIGENNYYKQQLLNNLKCPSISREQIKNLDYSSSNLIRFFIMYNKCEKAEFKNYTQKYDRTKFQLSVKGGIKNSSLEITNAATDYRDTDFGEQLGIRVGLEAEFILQFHNEKWGIVIEPTYQNFISRKETSKVTSEITYHSIEVPLGLRHYMYLDRDSKFFLNGMVVADLNFNSKFDFQREAISTLELNSGLNLALGLGYKYNNRYSVELRYHTNRDLMTNHRTWYSNYSTVALILGYSIL